MNIGSEGDDSPITGMISSKDLLYAVKARGIYAIQLADQVDPGRTNPRIPDTQQRILSMGSDDPVVARTFLTAHALFKKTHLGPDFEEERGVAIALDLLKDLVAMIAIRAKIEKVEAEQRVEYLSAKQEHRNLRLPAIGDTLTESDAFAQKVGHSVKHLEGISRLFFGDELKRKWVDTLAEISVRKFGAESNFANFIKQVRPTLLFLIDMRNMVEHPQSDSYLKIRDFLLLPTGEVQPPSFEMVRAGENISRGTLTILMAQITESVISISESLMGHLCATHLVPFGGLPVSVFSLPPEQRSNPHLSLCYGIRQGDKIVPFG